MSAASGIDANRELHLQQEVLAAIAGRTPLNLVGGGTKRFHGCGAFGRTLALSGHRGIVEYEPTELVITARGGTPLGEIESVLGGQGQMLAFEPPHFGTAATLGGTIASGLSGPRRPFAGAARDFVLGCRLLNGDAHVVSFGGTVMKNVAGFDVSRLMAGALGTLGILLEISLKVLPRPRAEIGLSFDFSPEVARARMIQWSSEGLPISGLSLDDRLHLRLSGAESAVRAAHRRIGGERDAGAADYWTALREQTLPFFGLPGELWRLSVPPAALQRDIDGRWLIDWGGAQRWLKTAARAAEVFEFARALGGHAALFRSARGAGCFQPLERQLEVLHRSVKQVFDPHGIFNIGRLYPGW